MKSIWKEPQQELRTVCNHCKNRRAKSWSWRSEKMQNQKLSTAWRFQQCIKNLNKLVGFLQCRILHIKSLMLTGVTGGYWWLPIMACDLHLLKHKPNQTKQNKKIFLHNSSITWIFVRFIIKKMAKMQSHCALVFTYKCESFRWSCSKLSPSVKKHQQKAGCGVTPHLVPN